MTDLCEPDEGLIARVLEKVGFEHRVVGYRLRERAGAITNPCYCFEEVVHLLNDKCPELNLEGLKEWLRTVIGDGELADRIAEIAREETCDHDRMLQVRMVMGKRLCQCKLASPQ